MSNIHAVRNIYPRGTVTKMHLVAIICNSCESPVMSLHIDALCSFKNIVGVTIFLFTCVPKKYMLTWGCVHGLSDHLTAPIYWNKL